MRLDRPKDAKTGDIAGPVGAALALIGPDSHLDANRMRETFSNVWGGVAFYDDRSSLTHARLLRAKGSWDGVALA